MAAESIFGLRSAATGTHHTRRVDVVTPASTIAVKVRQPHQSSVVLYHRDVAVCDGLIKVVNQLLYVRQLVVQVIEPARREHEFKKTNQF